ncbi:putative Tripartite ATP-independent periplasmic transporter DctQ component [uncultured delta proteobacterium]|uniref:Putative Tripartite ATP-independent periplasmic transporter DctQ component n=1 Tax=uncultured delta proteobacterium TaxID=34034 RepID=A0A212J4T6_9DELT|nr:putative Tripartite ATP-independent periplasmic transporter DctQ component [uncultured delta proteobacterium]
MRKFIDNFEEYAILVLFPVMVVVVLAATTARYTGFFSMFWGEEVARYTMVYLGYIGIALAMKRRAHIGVAVLTDMVKSKAGKRLVIIVQAAIILTFCGIISAFLFTIIGKQMVIGQTSPALMIPIWIAYAGVPLGMILLAVRTIQAYWGDWRRLDGEV